ncbi:MAG: hypothetical protein LBR93_11320, partial [Treponema sp.]|nr:hypothetical protein [Treponema sp.]
VSLLIPLSGIHSNHEKIGVISQNCCKKVLTREHIISGIRKKIWNFYTDSGILQPGFSKSGWF